MKLQTRYGEIIKVELSTDHPLALAGVPVLVDASGYAFGVVETISWIIEEATADERVALIHAGYGTIIDLETDETRSSSWR